MLPPYNEHQIRDVGDFYLAFTVLFAWAAWRPSRELVLPLASAWSVAALLHAGYHSLHLDGFGRRRRDRASVSAKRSTLSEAFWPID